MLALTGALALTAVIGFLAGREYDTYRKRVNENRRRRREEAERMQKERIANRNKKIKEKSDRFVAYTFYNSPGGF
jgi:CRISPR/Cas system-associated protein Cas5 (RAMP superfamily)